LLLLLSLLFLLFNFFFRREINFQNLSSISI